MMDAGEAGYEECQLSFGRDPNSLDHKRLEQTAWCMSLLFFGTSLASSQHQIAPLDKQRRHDATRLGYVLHSRYLVALRGSVLAKLAWLLMRLFSSILAAREYRPAIKRLPFAE